MEDAIRDLQARIEEETMASFEELTEHCERPVEVADTRLPALASIATGADIESDQRTEREGEAPASVV